MRKLPKNWVLRSSELIAYLGNRMAIKRLAEGGELQAVGSGIYASASLDPMVAAAAAVTKYFPLAVVSGRTALFLHQLADFPIERVDVDIPSDTKISNRLLAVRRVAKRKMVGVTEINVSGFPIRVYGLERALCDAYRLDPAGPTFFKALKRYLARKRPDTEKVAAYDGLLSTKVLVHLMQELADV
jgi:predicted transcriptional regulator of viral defense system